MSQTTFQNKPSSFAAKESIKVVERNEGGELKLPSSQVQIETTTVTHSVELDRVNTTISTLRAKLEEIERALIDEEKLQQEESKLIKERTILADKLKVEQERIKNAKENALLEERKLEEQRARKHSEAVEFENKRAELEAQKIVAQREAAHAEEMARQHKIAFDRALELKMAHLQALSEAEKAKAYLMEGLKTIQVTGELLRPSAGKTHIQVEVPPEIVPEARIATSSLVRGAAASGVIEEHIPVRPPVIPEKREAQEERVVEKVVKKVESHTTSKGASAVNFVETRAQQQKHR